MMAKTTLSFVIKRPFLFFEGQLSNLCRIHWHNQPKSLLGVKYFDFKRATVFGVGHRL